MVPSLDQAEIKAFLEAAMDEETILVASGVLYCFLNKTAEQRLPEDPCGRYLPFRHFIACGETQAATGLANLPEQVASDNALLDLAEQVLDPVIDWFGMIRLTYGFWSPALARAIRARGGGPIDPARDQQLQVTGARDRLPLKPCGCWPGWLMASDSSGQGAVG